MTELENGITKLGCVNHDCEKCKAKVEQEPVAYLVYDHGAQSQYLAFDDELGDMDGCEVTPLYTHPPVPTAQPKEEIPKAVFLAISNAGLTLVKTHNGYKLEMFAGIKAQSEQPKEPGQEPVAWESILGAVARGWCYEENANKTMDSELAVAIAKEVNALYTTPPQRTWVGLTDEEKLFANQMWRVMDADGFIKAIEAKLKEKNTWQDGDCKHCVNGCPACDARRQPNVLP